MEKLPQNGGGLIGQLRDLALKGSDDGNWNERAEQKSVHFRSMTLKGSEGDMVKVELEAQKVRQRLSNYALKTFYRLRASHIESGLVLDFLPQHVHEALRRQKVAVVDGEQETLTMFGNEDEIDEHEFDGYEDMEFRHVRSLDFILNGSGTVLSSVRQDIYEDNDLEGVEVFGLRSQHSGNVSDEEFQTVSLFGWGDNSETENPSELLAHPDLRKLELKRGTKELRSDLSFLEIVNGYVADKNLMKHSERDRRNSMLTMLAFLSCEKSSKDIQELL